MIKRCSSFDGKTPLLYLIATPIGNMGEISLRTKEVIEECDYIACEDTRNSGLLLKNLGYSKKLISCHEHNEEEASMKIISLLLSGEKVGYMSDAGYPAVSDPGNRLAKRCLESGINVSVVNGPSAAICGLVGSGMNSEHFLFYGFLNAKSKARKEELESIKDFPYTIIFYESPHRIMDTIDDLCGVLGNRNITLCRELTKLHEEYIHGTLEEIKTIDPSTLIGEMVLVVEGAKITQNEVETAQIIDELEIALEKLSPKEAIKFVSDKLDVKKNEVYDIYLNNLK